MTENWTINYGVRFFFQTMLNAPPGEDAAPATALAHGDALLALTIIIVILLVVILGLILGYLYLRGKGKVSPK